MSLVPALSSMDEVLQPTCPGVLRVFVSAPAFYSENFSYHLLIGVGTRFVASVEAGAPKMHKELLVSTGFDDVARTIIYTGRPMRVRKTPYVADWYDYLIPQFLYN
jgi:hypothetical protein